MVPMKLRDIPKFEKMNLSFGVNVLEFREKKPKDGEVCFKNPNVDLIYRSVNPTNNQIYLILINDGMFLLIIKTINILI